MKNTEKASAKRAKMPVGTGKTKKAKAPKSQYFTFLVYPDSAPNDWQVRLELIGQPIAISPLHDSDKSEKTETGYKKAHYHVLYVANNPVTADSVRRKVKAQLGPDVVSLVQIISSNMENMYKYLTHESKDAVAKKKHIYDKKDIVHLNGFDIERYITIDLATRKQLFQMLLQMIVDHELKNFRELMLQYKEIGPAYGIDSYGTLVDVMMLNTSLLRMAFDGNYQALGPKRQTGDIYALIEDQVNERVNAYLEEVIHERVGKRT